MVSPPQILSVDKGEKVFQVELAVFNGATDGENHNNMELVDTSVSLSTGSMKVFFLNKFVMDLLVSLGQGGCYFVIFFPLTLFSQPFKFITIQSSATITRATITRMPV